MIIDLGFSENAFSRLVAYLVADCFRTTADALPFKQPTDPAGAPPTRIYLDGLKVGLVQVARAGAPQSMKLNNVWYNWVLKESIVEPVRNPAGEWEAVS